MNSSAPITTSSGPAAQPLLPRRISPKAITDYRVCPRRVWFRYVAKVPQHDRPSPQLMLGNAVHGALDTFFGLRPEDRVPVEERLHQCLRAVWKRHRRANTFATHDEERDCGERGLRLLTDFASCFDTTIVPLARERWVSTRLNNGVELFGKVDRVDGDLRSDQSAGLDVIDYKTGRLVLDDEDIPDEPAAQVYLLASEDEYGRQVRRVRFIYLAAGTEARWEPEREDVDAMRERLVELTWTMYRDQTFEARPGEHCARCPYAHVCPDAGRVELRDLEVAGELAF